MRARQRKSIELLRIRSSFLTEILLLAFLVSACAPLQRSGEANTGQLQGLIASTREEVVSLQDRLESVEDSQVDFQENTAELLQDLAQRIAELSERLEELERGNGGSVAEETN